MNILKIKKNFFLLENIHFSKLTIFEGSFLDIKINLLKADRIYAIKTSDSDRNSIEFYRFENKNFFTSKSLKNNKLRITSSVQLIIYHMA